MGIDFHESVKNDEKERRNKHITMAKNKQRRREKCICEKQACKCRQNIRKGKAEEAIRDMTVGMVRAK
jgi:hypothetical protein